MSNKLLPVQNLSTLEGMIVSQEENLAALLPSDMSLDFMRANIIAACSDKPKLITDCTRSSLMQAVFEACELGLMVHSSLSEAWIVPYKNKATFIPGYQGLTKLAYNAGFVRRIESRAVFTNDEFECEYGINPKLYLRENHANRGLITGVYCLVELMTGGVIYDFYPIEKLEEIRGRSASWRYKGDKHEIWGDDHNTIEMYRKAVWKNVSKWVPRSGTRYARALDIDERDYTGYYDQDQDAEERLYAAVGAGKKEEPEPIFITDVINLLSVYNSDDPIKELLGMLPLFLSYSPRGSDEVVKVKLDSLSEMTDEQADSVVKIIGRLRDAKGYDDERIVKFLRYCEFTSSLINTTRNLDAACKDFIESERRDRDGAV